MQGACLGLASLCRGLLGWGGLLAGWRLLLFLRGTLAHSPMGYTPVSGIGGKAWAAGSHPQLGHPNPEGGVLWVSLLFWFPVSDGEGAWSPDASADSGQALVWVICG